MARGIAIEGEPRHRGLHLPPKVILPAAGILAALAVGGYALSRGGEPNADQQFVPQTAGQDAPPPAGSGGDGEPPKLPAVVAPLTPDTPAETKSAPKPEIQPFDNGIVSPEAYTKAEYIEWSVQGATVRGFGFILQKGEKLRIPEDLQVATDEYPKPHTYNGRRIVGVNNSGQRFTFIGAITAIVGLTNVGKNLSAETIVGTMTDSATSVLEGTKYNLLILLPEDNRQKRFPDQTKNPPKKINNTFTEPVSSDLAFHDLKPPQ